MISMTGYGYAEHQDESAGASVEIKSYNNRYLDLSCSLPGSLSSLEGRIRDKVSTATNRGRVEVYIRFRDTSTALKVTVDSAALDGYLAAIEDLRERAGISEALRLDHLLGLEGILKGEDATDSEAAWSVIEPLLDTAIEQFAESRRREGEGLLRDIKDQLSRIERCVDLFESHAAEIEERIHSGLKQRFAEVLGDEIDEKRVLTEVAVQLTRFSINEEIVRLRSHISSFRETAANVSTAPGPVGKKLDFLCQELNREINTTGSKSIIVEINQQVVEAKDALENVREQLRNVE